MKITLLRNPSSTLGECNLKEGQTGDVKAEFAEKLIAAGIAEVPGRSERIAREAAAKAAKEKAQRKADLENQGSNANQTS